LLHHYTMPDFSTCRVRSAEVFRNGILVTFADGKCALFPADFLYSSLPEAEELSDSDDDQTSD
jgi:hypothetical protein